MTTTSRARRTFPTLRLLVAPFRWPFASRRRAQTAAAILAAALAAPVLWWHIQLLGLPDIGDPFDVRAFRSFTIPDDTNAFVLYRQAADHLKPLDAMNPSHDRKIDPAVSWSEADSLVWCWVEENRESMEIFRRGSERPDALDRDLMSNPRRHPRMIEPLRSFQALALLEASRLEEGGYMAGAWAWYRTALRAARHLGRHGSAIMRIVGQGWEGRVRKRITAWATDPRTTPERIRSAIDDVTACESLRPSESYTIKAEYADLETLLNEPDSPGHLGAVSALRGKMMSWGYMLPFEHLRTIATAWRFWRREPERSHRVLRIVIANWLAYWDLPPDRRPAPDPGVSGTHDFYSFGPDAPAGARALSPGALDRWLGTTYDARVFDFGIWDLRSLRIRERANRRALVVLLASELYRRDHGSDPPTDEALVGPYLKGLPAQGPDDGTSPAGAAAATPSASDPKAPEESK